MGGTPGRRHAKRRTTQHVFDGINGLVVEPRNPWMIAAAVAELLAPRQSSRNGRARSHPRRGGQFEPKRASDRLFAELGRRKSRGPERPHEIMYQISGDPFCASVAHAARKRATEHAHGHV